MRDALAGLASGGGGSPRLAVEFRAAEIALFAFEDEAGWRKLVSARIDAPDLNDQAANMRRAATKLTGAASPGVDIWLPKDQVANLELSPGVGEPRAAAIRQLVEGSAVSADELVVDAVAHKGGHAASAAEKTVVAEARAYISRWGFRPLRVTTRHGHPAFQKGPTFAAAPVSKPLLAGAAAAAVVVVAGLGWALMSGGEPAPEAVATAEPPVVIAAEQAAAPEAPEDGDEAEEVALATPEAPPEPVVAPPAPAAPEAEAPIAEPSTDEAPVEPFAEEAPAEAETTADAEPEPITAEPSVTEAAPAAPSASFVAMADAALTAPTALGPSPDAHVRPEPPSGSAEGRGSVPEAPEAAAPAEAIALDHAPVVLATAAGAPPPAVRGGGPDQPGRIILAAVKVAGPSAKGARPEAPEDVGRFSVPLSLSAELRLFGDEADPPAAPTNGDETRVAARGDAATAPREAQAPEAAGVAIPEEAAAAPDDPPETEFEEGGETGDEPADSAEAETEVAVATPPPAASDDDDKATTVERRRLTVTSDPRAAGTPAEAEASPVEEEDPYAEGPGAVARSPSPAPRPDALDMTPSKLALATAPAPAPRPKSIRPRAEPAAASSGGAARTVSRPQRNPPTGPGVANAATLNNALALDQMNLIGVFGSNGSRRALLRMPNGEVRRVTKGAVVEGWVVSRIDKDAMRITRGGEAQVLKVVQ